MTKISIVLSVGAMLASTAVMGTAASAATAHNSQAGGYGPSSNAGDSTVGSRHVKHADKHLMR